MMMAIDNFKNQANLTMRIFLVVVGLYFISSSVFAQEMPRGGRNRINIDSLRNSESFQQESRKAADNIHERGEKVKSDIKNSKEGQSGNLKRIQTRQSIVVSQNLESLEDELELERDALIILYNTLFGDSWYNNSGWKTGGVFSDVVTNDWYGITVNEDGRVIKIELSDNNVGHLWNRPSIPDIFEELPLLQVLDLSENVRVTNDLIYGQIPSSIFDLQFLEVLDLSRLDELEGEIDITNLSNLKILDLNGCDNLTFAFGSEIGNLTELSFLDLTAVQVTGQIPPEIGNLGKLTFLSLHGIWGNDFCYLPSEFVNLESLKEFHFGWGNAFQHCFDINTLGNLPPNIEYIDGIYSGLSGTLPDALGNLSKLKHLDLGFNNLEGELPMSLNNLENLESLFLPNNFLTGDLPFELIGTLSNISISSNRFTFRNFLPFVGTTPSISYGFQDWVDEYKLHEPVIGGSYSLVTEIDRETNPPSKYQWFKYLDWNNSIPLTSEPTYEGHTFFFEEINSGLDGEYYYIIVNEAAPDLTLRSFNQELQALEGCIELDQVSIGSNISYGEVYFFVEDIGPGDCEILEYAWHFGDGNTSDLPSPTHTYAASGEYEVQLTVQYECDDACGVRSQTVMHLLTIEEPSCDCNSVINNNIPTNGLQAHYKFDESLLDFSGNDFHGSEIGEIVFGGDIQCQSVSLKIIPMTPLASTIRLLQDLAIFLSFFMANCTA